MENENEHISLDKTVVLASNATKPTDSNTLQRSGELALSMTSLSSYHTRLRANLRFHPRLHSHQIEFIQLISLCINNTALTNTPIRCSCMVAVCLSVCLHVCLPGSWPSVCATSCVALTIISGESLTLLATTIHLSHLISSCHFSSTITIGDSFHLFLRINPFYYLTSMHRRLPSQLTRPARSHLRNYTISIPTAAATFITNRQYQGSQSSHA